MVHVRRIRATSHLALYSKLTALILVVIKLKFVSANTENVLILFLRDTPVV